MSGGTGVRKMRMRGRVRVTVYNSIELRVKVRVRAWEHPSCRMAAGELIFVGQWGGSVLLVGRKTIGLKRSNAYVAVLLEKRCCASVCIRRMQNGGLDPKKIDFPTNTSPIGIIFKNGCVILFLGIQETSDPRAMASAFKKSEFFGFEEDTDAQLTLLRCGITQ